MSKNEDHLDLDHILFKMILKILKQFFSVVK